MFSILGLKTLVYILIKPLNVSLHYSDGGMKTKQKKETSLWVIYKKIICLASEH